MGLIFEVQRTLTSIIWGGVLSDFRSSRSFRRKTTWAGFRTSCIELDHANEKFGTLATEPLPMRPSEYIKRQVWAIFLDDPVGPKTYELFGENNYMWGSDFPHTYSTWPKSREVIAKDFAGVPDEVTRKITFHNAARLYGLTGEKTARSADERRRMKFGRRLNLRFALTSPHSIRQQESNTDELQRIGEQITGTLGFTERTRPLGGFAWR